MTAAIAASHVSKAFSIPHERRTTLKEYVLHPLRRTTYERNQALADLSFEIEEGEFFGVIGPNGSGKSTLLRVLAGIYPADSGHVRVNGIVSPFIELGVGFNYELNARDNIVINGTLLGLSRRELEAKFDEVLEFGELERFVDQKLKNYSSGMLLRLAYSIAIQVPFDILLLDEVLAVGDESFQKKCFATFESFRNHGKTVVFVSHDLSSVARYCDRAIALVGGQIVAAGPTHEVIEMYRRIENRRALGSRTPTAGVAPIANETASRAAGSTAVATRVRVQPKSNGAWSTEPDPAVETDVGSIVAEFQAPHYQRHNQRRLEHLASLDLDLFGKSVLEVGAGIGDHTSFFLDRGCDVTATDLREENVAILRSRYPNVRTGIIDLDAPDPELEITGEIVFCYGTLYHLERPADALAFLARSCSSLFLLETAVSPGEDERLHLVTEGVSPATGATGTGNRPTRRWVYARLRELFPHIYVPLTQPAHSDFPIDWSAKLPYGIGRVIFVASLEPLVNPLLATELPTRQARH